MSQFTTETHHMLEQIGLQLVRHKLSTLRLQFGFELVCECGRSWGNTISKCFKSLEPDCICQ